MGKKSDIPKPAATPAPATKPAAAKKPAPKKTAVKKTAITKPAYTQDDVALRAYYIGEKRQKAGLPGDSHHDWIEAEKQLKAESKKKAAKGA